MDAEIFGPSDREAAAKSLTYYSVADYLFLFLRYVAAECTESVRGMIYPRIKSHRYGQVVAGLAWVKVRVQVVMWIATPRTANLKRTFPRVDRISVLHDAVIR